jgi:hypothetical protein
LRKISKKRVLRKIFRVSKGIKFSLRTPQKTCQPVFILGSGRSGTTILLDVFHFDQRVQSYGENNRKIAKNFILDFSKLNKELGKKKATHFVCKPILNSYDVPFILKNYPDCRILWLFRNYKDVIASSAVKFGLRTSILLKDAIDNNFSDNWISRGIDSEARKKISEMHKNGLSSYDYMGLIWWSVNRTVVIHKLNKDKRFKLISYENLVQNSQLELKSIYNFIGLKYLETSLRFHNKSLSRGKNLHLNPAVDKMCDHLMTHLKSLA